MQHSFTDACADTSTISFSHCSSYSNADNISKQISHSKSNQVSHACAHGVPYSATYGASVTQPYVGSDSHPHFHTDEASYDYQLHKSEERWL